MCKNVNITRIIRRIATIETETPITTDVTILIGNALNIENYKQKSIFNKIIL